MVITRFAPSPTGRLHAGNIRTALVNWLLARSHGGRFLLRLDDTDAARSTDAAAAGIREDLDWLGLAPDDEVRQSDRFALYDAALETLAAAGRVYRAYETPEELELKRRVQQGRGLPPIYDRAALALSDADHARMATEGRAPHWRFRLDHAAPIQWTDGVRGPCQFDPAMLSDPVIRRADCSWLYLLPSVVDDIDMRISHVVRGEDHVSNSAVQLQMFAALGAEPPALAHLALLTGADAALSKRIGSAGVGEWQADGIEALAVVALLARLGTSQPVEPIASLDALVEGFSLAHFGRAPARFDPADLAALSARILHGLPFETVAARLPGLTEPLWLAVRGNLERLEDAARWQAVIDGPVRTDIDVAEREYLGLAADTLGQLPWRDEIWADLIAELKGTSGRKGKALFLPLRLALTGEAHGPEMAALLPLIGQTAATERLRAAASG
ncbi:glutamyl-tRNA synthetase [Polymorphobacter multimanifer]|uniref:Glutamate--tRNA ligase n=1 Tax=Polymorphobacter multimanifer TaxID=1070431 RepID=A0A841LDR0_9SPHN|nr:glutamate--tRNA ligase [Polymorphobacter multimanifer]MBB6227118.1 glutamyl-tRNA synthetase [Polymorphobacter multimanifer]